MTAADRPPVTDNARAEAGWIEWAQNLTGAYVTTAEEARQQIEGLVSGLLELTGLDRAAGRAEARNVSHIGRSFHGTRLEDDCPCPKGPCGLAIHDGTDHGCDQHDLGAARTIRQMHSAAGCPAAGCAETTTATDEDAIRSLRAWVSDHASEAIDRQALKREIDRRITALATARTRPTREQQQVAAVEALAAAWEARGEHDMAYSKTLPDDIAQAIYEAGAEMVERARHIRVALAKPTSDEHTAACSAVWMAAGGCTCAEQEAARG